MKPFKSHKGILASLERANVDTDQIIPKQFLKSVKRTGFGESLFFDWRYLAGGKPDPSFELNRPEFKGASILVAGNNFGCGSSREHAVWAISQYGFRVIVAPRMENKTGGVPGFADIFRNNCVKNSVLTVELSDAEVKKIFDIISGVPGTKASVSITEQTLTVHAKNDTLFHFKIDPSVKTRLVEGLDDIGITLCHKSSIDNFEKTHQTYL